VIGTIERISPKGKSNIVRVDGADYFIRSDIDISSMRVGGKLDFTYSPNVYNGKTYNWIKNWGAIPPEGNGVHAPADVRAPAPSHAQEAVKSPSAGAPTPMVDSTEPFINSMHLPCISNALAHLIDSKMIVKPEDLWPWIEKLNSNLNGTPF